MTTAPPDTGRARALVDDARRLVVFTGAGMSAESGVPTFRDALTGLWERFDPADLATPEAWRRDRTLVWSWYAQRAAGVRRVAPNAGHHAVARLADRKKAAGGEVSVITQNVDDLHERAGSTGVTHLHGSLFAPRCERCGAPAGPDTALAPAPPSCPACGEPIRPGVVWFGEQLPERAWAHAQRVFQAADLVIVVGTSGVVHPAAELPETAAREGIPVIEVNPEASALRGVRLRLTMTSAAGLPRLLG